DFLRVERVERARNRGYRSHHNATGVSQNAFDQGGDHCFVFDHQHPPSGEPAVHTHDPPRTASHTHSSGTRRLARHPPSAKSIFTLPPSPWATSRSIKLSPKPGWATFVGFGPSFSAQSITNWARLCVSTDHVTSSRPCSTEREPYFAALVPSS